MDKQRHPHSFWNGASMILGLYIVYCIARADIDECALGIDTCEQRCVNVPGSYKCGCRRGSFLAPDNSSCSRM
jgi:hypothetical protein